MSLRVQNSIQEFQVHYCVPSLDVARSDNHCVPSRNGTRSDNHCVPSLNGTRSENTPEFEARTLDWAYRESWIIGAVNCENSWNLVCTSLQYVMAVQVTLHVLGLHGDSRPTCNLLHSRSAVELAGSVVHRNRSRSYVF